MGCVLIIASEQSRAAVKLFRAAHETEHIKKNVAL